MASEWNTAEKRIARRVFDAAVQYEFAELVQAFKSMAAQASEPNDMWSTEEFLTRSRLAFDKKYDFKYSPLELLFARLLREGRISEAQLAGLAPEKVLGIVRASAL